MLITVAGRAIRPDLATKFYAAYKVSGTTPAKHVDNALLAALARHAPMKEVRSEWKLIYRRLVYLPQTLPIASILPILPNDSFPLLQVLATYRQMLKEGLVPDVYSFNALLTSMSRVGASLYAVQDLVGEMSKWNVKVGIALGFALV